MSYLSGLVKRSSRSALGARGHLLLAGAVVAIGLCAGPATASAAPAITVSPDYGLDRDTEPVTVRGTDFKSPGVKIYQCPSGHTAIEQCDELGSDTILDGDFTTFLSLHAELVADDPSYPLWSCVWQECEVLALGSNGMERAEARVVFVMPYPRPPTPPTPPGYGSGAPTGEQAAAISRCAKRFSKGTKKRKQCVRRARKLPV